MSDDDVDQGEMPDQLDAFFDDLRTAVADTPAPRPSDALATLFREGTAPVAAPLRRRWAVRAVVAGAVGSLAFGGLGVAGALPRPVQARVADVVGHVGVHLPDARPATPTTTVTVPPANTNTTVPPTTAAPPRHPVAPTTTADDHRGSGGGDGTSGDNGSGDGRPGDGTSGKDSSGTDGSGHDGSGSEHNSKSRSGEQSDAHVEQSGRISDDVSGVHLDNGSDHSGHDDEGRSP
jgi:hypothetical protein